MTPQELKATILASGLNNSQFARELGIAYRTLTRMLRGDIAITDRMEASVRHMLGAAEAAHPDWPRDAWIVGEGAPPERREYVIHAAPPRFVARVVAIDELTDRAEPDEEPVDLLSGVIYSAGEGAICEIAWIDPAPTDPTELRQLLEEAADQLEWDG